MNIWFLRQIVRSFNNWQYMHITFYMICMNCSLILNYMLLMIFLLLAFIDSGIKAKRILFIL
jgi:hypothetical protein